MNKDKIREYAIQYHQDKLVDVGKLYLSIFPEDFEKGEKNKLRTARNRALGLMCSIEYEEIIEEISQNKLELKDIEVDLDNPDSIKTFVKERLLEIHKIASQLTDEGQFRDKNVMLRSLDMLGRSGGIYKKIDDTPTETSWEIK